MSKGLVRKVVQALGGNDDSPKEDFVLFSAEDVVEVLQSSEMTTMPGSSENEESSQSITAANSPERSTSQVRAGAS